MKPMLAHTYDGEHRLTYPLFVQPKFNGVRALYQGGHFQSRDELPWNDAVLRHISEPLKQIFDSSIVLDGELYVHGWPLQRINGAVAISRTAPREDTHLVCYVIFDRVDFNLSFEERFAFVQDEVHRFHSLALPFWPALTQKVENERQVNAFYTKVVHEGFEGIVYRLGPCLYTIPKQQLWPNSEQDRIRGVVGYNTIRATMGATRRRFLSDKNNRTWHLLKRKAWQDGEFPCVELEEGLGKRSGMVGAFVCSHDGERFRVGSGLSDDEATHYLQHPEEILGRKIKVKFLTMTERGVPFNPIFEELQ